MHKNIVSSEFHKHNYISRATEHYLSWQYNKIHGNVLGANQFLRANYENFNLGHRINIQGARGIV